MTISSMNDEGLFIQYSHDGCNSNHRSSYTKRTTALSQFVQVTPPAKPSPPLRRTTSATLALSSACSYHTKSPSSSSSPSSCRNNWRWDGSLNDDDDIDHEEEEHDNLEMLMIRSFRYRERCLLLERRLCQRALEMQYLHSQVAGQEIGRVLSLETYMSRRHPSPLQDRPLPPSLPMTPKKKPPQQASTKLRLSDAARKHELLSEADQKQRLHPALPQSIACSPFAIAPGPPVKRNEQSCNEVLGFDPEEVQRQRAILQDIRQRNRSSSTSNTPSQFVIAKKPPKPMDTTPQSPGRAAAPVGIHPPGSPPQVNPGTERLSSSPSRMDRRTTEDWVTCLSNGKTVWVKGTRHTYKSIIMGRATLVQCPACHTVLQISDTAKLVYCTACQEVSPFDAGDASANSSPNPSASNAAARMQWDGHIARALQRQEINVGRTMNQAKQAASSIL